MNYGCNGCNDEGVYAEILEYKKNASDDMFASIIVEDATREAAKGDKLPIVVYACPVDGAPIKLNPDQYNVTVTTGSSTYANGIVTVADTSVVTVKFAPNDKLSDTMNITVA